MNFGLTEEQQMVKDMRDAKICQIHEGTNEIMRVVVARKLLSMR